METALRPQVIANIPTYFDKGTSNNIENYSLDESGDTREVHCGWWQTKSSVIVK